MECFDAPLDRCSPSKEGEPSLHRAARVGDCAEIRRLVAAGEKVDSTFNTEPDPDAYERVATPFMVAAGSDDGACVETLRVLQELGADPKMVIDGRSAATFACQGLACWYKPGGDAERLKFVLAAGSPLPGDPSASNRLLCDIAAIGDHARLHVLLEHGLNARGYWDPVKARESHERTMGRINATRENEPDIVALMTEDMRASMEEWTKKMDAEMLEQQCAAPSAYQIPLFRAAESGNAECVRLLIAAGAEIFIRHNSKRTAVYSASSAEVIGVLMQAGLSLEDADQYGWSPLDNAVSDGESGLSRVQALIGAGANVNGTHDRGYTVFMSAVGSNRHPEVLRLLIASGADPHAVTELGYNVFHAAIDVNFEANAEESVRDTLGYLKELGVNIEHRNIGNKTPLARAIEEGTGTEVRVLCELGADANAVCRKHDCGGESCTRGDLPLLFHATDGIGVHKDVKTEALLRAGANPLAKDEQGFTPLMHVVASICQDAANYSESYQTFFRGLSELRLEGKPMPRSREEFVAEAAPFLRAYVEEFAREIPVSEDSEYASEWRQENISCIVSLAAYEGWFRHEQRARRE